MLLDHYDEYNLEEYDPRVAIQSPKFEVEPGSFVEYANNLGRSNLNQPRFIGTRYDHAVRIANNLTFHADERLQDEVIAASLIHDILDSKSEDEGDFNWQELMQYEGGHYVLGILLATERFEEHAEQWRILIKYAAYGDENDGDTQLLNELLESCCEGDCDLDALKEELTLSLFSKGKDNLDKPLNEALWNFRAPIVDIENSVEMLNNLDIEALILKTFEVVDNIRFANPRNKIAGWRDAQEIISFYAPLIEICGFESVATEAYGVALEYLNTKGEMAESVKDETTISLVKRYHQVEQFMKSNNIYSLLLKSIDIGDLFETDDDQWSIKRKPNWGHKTLGSFLEKCRLKKSDRDNLMTPDFGGIRLNISDSIMDADPEGVSIDIFHVISERLANYSKGRIVPGNTRGDHVLELTYGANTKKRTTNLNGSGFTATIGPERKSGYNAAHMSFMVIDDDNLPIGIEVQVTSNRAEYVNTYGEASHIIYKANNTFGNLGHIKRVLDSTPTEDPNYHQLRLYYQSNVLRFTNSIESIRERADEFKQRQTIKLTDYTHGLVQEFIEQKKAS